MAEIKNKRATILSIIGIVLVIIGGGIAIIHNPLRGSGLGTICIVAGVILLIIGLLRFNKGK